MHKSRWWIISGALFLLIFTLSQPIGVTLPGYLARPCQNYAEAAQRIDSLGRSLPDSLHDLCGLRFMDQGRRTGHVVVLIHGYTNCPEQFAELGRQWRDSLRCNVLIAPLPLHGLADRLTRRHQHLKAEDLAAYANEMTDLAAGLGDTVIMAGLSAGALAVAWAAQNRKEIDEALLIAPVFGFKAVPAGLTALAMNLSRVLPDQFSWWNPDLKDKGGQQHGYPQHSRRALAQLLRLGFAVKKQARQVKPKAGRLIVVSNGNDKAVNQAMIERMVDLWEGHDTRLTLYRFPESLQLDHDMIDPHHPKAKTALVYPKLWKLLMER